MSNKIDTNVEEKNNRRDLLGITVSKSTNFSAWYREIISKAKLVEYTDISGCYAYMPASYEVWELIQKYMDVKLKSMGVRNVYFPIFITETNLNVEKEHVEGFTPEVAWVTHAGDNKLDVKMAVRPTSECAIYPIMSKVVKEGQMLPIKWNQWCNVVRWEFRDPTPFIRSREFLWQEGHTCHRTREAALNELDDIIKIYQETYHLMCIPTIPGTKTRFEKFAGAEETHTIETYIHGANKAVQAATAHLLGTTFSKRESFNICIQQPTSDIDNPSFIDVPLIQNSWGFTTRSIGIMVMTHSDDIGLVIPPKIASRQFVIIPITSSKNSEEVNKFAQHVSQILGSKYRVFVDDNPNFKPGRKYCKYELEGIPFRIEIGQKEASQNRITLVSRISNPKVKISIDVDDNLFNVIDKQIEIFHEVLYLAAITKLDQCIYINSGNDAMSTEFIQTLLKDHIIYTKWCDTEICEEALHKIFHAKTLCIPTEEFKHKIHLNGQNDICGICYKQATKDVLIGKSF